MPICLQIFMGILDDGFTPLNRKAGMYVYSVMNFDVVMLYFDPICDIFVIMKIMILTV